MPTNHSSTATLPTVTTVTVVDHVQVAETPVQARGDTEVPTGPHSPRDTVWKRVFSGQTPLKQQAAQVSGSEQPPAMQACSATASNTSLPGVPRLALPSSGPQLSPTDSAFGHELCPTERNTLPATERARPISTERARPVQMMGPARSPPQSAKGSPAVLHRSTDITRDESRERIRLSEGDSQSKEAQPMPLESSPFSLPPWRTASVQGAKRQASAESDIVTEPNTGRISALQRGLGEFGVPDAPVTIDMAPLLAKNEPCASPVPESPIQSFAATAAPSRQSQNETFMQTASSQKQAGAGCAQAVQAKQFAEVPTPLRNQSAFVSNDAGYDRAELAQRRPVLDCLAENTQPLQSRVRGLPGNTCQTGEQPTPSKANRREGEQRQQGSAQKQKTQQRPMPSPRPTTAEDTVQAAAQAVTLRDLAELRSFRNPPPAVIQVLEPLAVLLGVSDTRWAKMRKLLDGNLLGRLFSFDPSMLTQQQVDRVAVCLDAPAFSDGSLHEKCPAAVSLAAWCDAIMQYVEMIQPESPAAGRENMRNENVPANGVSCQSDLGGVTVEPNIWAMSETELSRVKGLCFTREGVGSMYFHGETDVRDVLPHLADVVQLQPGEVVVYPHPGTKPPVGTGLNKAADITLFGCMPKTRGFADHKAKERYRRRVKQMTEDKGAEFLDYDCERGTWKFRVSHF